MSAKSKAEKHADTLAGMIDGKDDDLAKTLEPIRKFLLSLDKAEKTKSASDSKLVAATPELLEALKNFVVLYKQDQIVIEGDNGNDPVVAKALAAIAKATGKS